MSHRSSWGAPRWPPRSFKRKGLRPPRTPPAIARTRPGGAVARLGLDTGWLITAPRLHQSVELPRVLARDLRSEERRVGKECRFWWSPCGCKKKMTSSIVYDVIRHCSLERT